MGENNFYFYVLECADGSYYGGYTVDLEKRVKAHNAGKGAKYTRARIPVQLIYSEKFASKSEAMSAEYRFKQLNRKKKAEFLKGAGGSENTKEFPK